MYPSFVLGVFRDIVGMRLTIQYCPMISSSRVWCLMPRCRLVESASSPAGAGLPSTGNSSASSASSPSTGGSSTSSSASPSASALGLPTGGGQGPGANPSAGGSGSSSPMRGSSCRSKSRPCNSNGCAGHDCRKLRAIGGRYFIWQRKIICKVNPPVVHLLPGISINLNGFANYDLTANITEVQCCNPSGSRIPRTIGCWIGHLLIYCSSRPSS